MLSNCSSTTVYGHRPPAQPYHFLHRSDALKSLVADVALFCYDRQQQLINLQQAVFPSHTLIVATVSIKKKDSLNKIENLKDHVSVSEDSRISQMDRPLLKSKLNTDQEGITTKKQEKTSYTFF
ncbi:hypothetical protein L2E82_12296 [Cichorium intybus]|uniref:Uncharacterized protein n=1 Tax=Cichorium intybus TaxID=13427 RepID=A0ACB9GGB5_CICIN|nr:hypothetical protein L2E82_12296 [Cichorium intybus]